LTPDSFCVNFAREIITLRFLRGFLLRSFSLRVPEGEPMLKCSLAKKMPGDRSMKCLFHFEVLALYEKTYSDGYCKHGDLDLEIEVYLAHLRLIIENHLGANPPAAVTMSFIYKLHTNDLYLSKACAQGSEIAWNQFASKYGKYLKDLARFACNSLDLGIEIADQVMVNMFLPDKSGRSRIASFDGRSSLAAWLRVIVNNQALRERKRKCNNLEALEDLPEVADEMAMGKVYALLRAHRYEPLINEALKEAIEKLSARERAMLLLRCEEELQVTEIARIFSVNPSTVTRALQMIQQRIRDGVASILSCRHGLNNDAIKECFIDIIENPGYRVLAPVK
jgi:RNA polymerase sigma-70 factor (ECF subfamily)